MAGTIDFPDDSSASIPAGLWNTHKLVAQCSQKTHIALTQLHVGFADPGLQNIDSNLTRLGFPELGIASKMQVSVKNYSTHGSILIRSEKSVMCVLKKIGVYQTGHESYVVSAQFVIGYRDPEILDKICRIRAFRSVECCNHRVLIACSENTGLFPYTDLPQ
jgi:hypothetical protein